MRPFGDRLRDARKAAQLQQRELGEKLGVSNSAISSWETGRDVPSFTMLPHLRAALGVSLDDLICGDRESVSAAKAAMKIMEGASPAYGKDPAQERAEQELLARFRELGSRKARALLELLKPGR